LVNCVQEEGVSIRKHHTLRATFDWSYELLPEPERVILRRLAVFAGPFSLDAAGAVAGSPLEISPWEVVEGLSSPVAKSLVAKEGNRQFANHLEAITKLRSGPVTATRRGLSSWLAFRVVHLMRPVRYGIQDAEDVRFV
jgi:hypothetical protein